MYKTRKNFGSHVSWASSPSPEQLHKADTSNRSTIRLQNPWPALHRDNWAAY